MRGWVQEITDHDRLDHECTHTLSTLPFQRHANDSAGSKACRAQVGQTGKPGGKNDGRLMTKKKKTIVGGVDVTDPSHTSRKEKERVRKHCRYIMEDSKEVALLQIR